MNKFWESLQTPRSTARKRKPAPKYDFADLEKDNVPASFRRPEALQKGIELASRSNGRNKGIQIVV